MSSPSTPITVSELTFAIKSQLESRYSFVIVQGEISNCKLHSSGHFYFDLKDDKAKISGVMFRASLARQPKEGDHVIITGALSVYPPHGKYQLLARKLEYAGVGELLLKLEALKKSLHERGWFAPERKKALPKFPKTIGVVTSATGAVIQDIINVLTRRFPGFHLILNPVHVQGTEAAREIAQAIEQFNQYQLADVLIVGRGGGSLEDLWPFNEEIVAKAIFESAIPIVSAVGHETDVTIADFVADLRAPTPSAAAEIISAATAHTQETLSKMRLNISHAVLHHVKQVRFQLNGFMRHPNFANPYTLLAAPLQKLDDLKIRLDQKIQQSILKKRYLLSARQKQASALKPLTQLKHSREKLSLLSKNMDQALSTLMKTKRQKLKEIVQHLKSLDPKNVLKRGYAILFALNEGSVIVTAQDLRDGQQVRALLSDGEATLTVNQPFIHHGN